MYGTRQTTHGFILSHYGAIDAEIVADLNVESLDAAHQKNVTGPRELRAVQAPRAGIADVFNTLPWIRCARASGKLQWLTAHSSSARSGAAAPPARALAVI